MAGGWRRAPDPRQIEAMFDGIVEHYDLLNRIISLGQDRSWRRAAVDSLLLESGDRVLDLGCGTGDLAAALLGRAMVVGVDLSAAMLKRAQDRLSGAVPLVRGSAFQLPFRDASFRAAVSGFLLRNLRDLEAAFSELARVLEPGGQIALLDATQPRQPWLRQLFRIYFGVAAPALGTLAGKANAYRYLSTSLVQIPEPAELCRLLNAAGFVNCAARPLTLGAVTLFRATRSGSPPNSEARLGPPAPRP